MAGFSMVFPFLPLYIKQVGIATWGSVEFWSGMVFSAQPMTMMISAPLWGAAADRFGRKLMLVRAALGGAVILAVMGFARSAEQLVLLRALQGMVTGTLPAANALVAASAPRERSGWALGLLQTGAWVGVAVGPLIGGLVGDAFGFRESFWVTGILLAFSGFTVLIFVHEDFTPRDKKSRAPLLEGLRLLLRSPKMFALYTTTFLHALGRMFIYPIAALFIMELRGAASGVATVTGLMMGTMAVTGSLSAVWLGRLGDRIGHVKVLLGAILAAVLFSLPQTVVSAAWQLVVLQALLGAANGGMIPAIGALLNLQTPPGSQGATYGFNASIMAAGRSLAPMAGAGFAIWFGMRSVFVLTALVYVLSALVILRFRREGENA